MKKLLLIIFTSCLLLGLAGCAKKAEDPFKGMRGKSAQTLLNEGEQNLAKRKYGAAIKSFEALQGLYPFSQYSEQAQLDVIYAYYKNDSSDLAIIAADRYIRLYPNGKHVDYAYYMRGFVGLTAGQTWLRKFSPADPAARDVDRLQKAFSAFNLLVQQYPNSPYAPAARRDMVLIRNLMARHEILVAQFYLERKAYVASANRAATVVQHYQGTQSVPEALAILVLSYRALNLPKEADDAYKIMQKNYANTKAFHDLNAKLAKK